MKIQVFSSRFKPLYSPSTELPREFCVTENCVVKISYKPEPCPKECTMDSPFGNKAVEVCCENCKP